jgi:DNA mismatch repair protein MutL
MGKIHLLENNLIDKIAAGEVVERPASVVKELLENSIDAGATALTVEIRDGGISFIRITDNGKGIPKDEIRTAFMRHATSKLYAFEDLEDILTLGFRGEALSSIASVADVEMITRTAEDNEGTKIELSGGKVVDEMPSAAEVGTIFTVKNLFYNTPARRKFLKKPATESGYVAEVVNRIALGHPHIAVKYINNGNVMLQTSGNNDLRTVMLYIYGKEQASKMVEVELKRDGYSLKGLTCKSELSRANRSYESFFINGRYVKSGVVSSAAEEAYKGRLMTGKFPVFAFNLTVPKNTVDVNVHPTKLEVRFSDEDFIYNLVYDAVTKAFKDKELIPSVTWDKPEKKEEAKPKAEQTKLDVDDNFKYNAPVKEKKAVRLAEDLSASTEEMPKGKSVSDIVNALYGNEPKVTAEEKTAEPQPRATFEVKPEPIVKEKVKEEKAVKRERFFTHYKIVGQVFNTYWIVEQDDKMYMIDQHAAHERVLYERLTKKMTEGDSVSQLLLQPIAVRLTEAEKAVVEENRELLESFGYEIEELGPNACALRAVPCVFDSPTNASFFTDIVDILKSKSIKSIYETKLDAIATMSCKAAVKGNNKLSFSEAKALIEQMLELENPFNCPHGRPTVIEMSKYEVEKKFKRIV